VASCIPRWFTASPVPLPYPRRRSVYDGQSTAIQVLNRNRVRCTVTSLIETKALSLCQVSHCCIKSFSDLVRPSLIYRSTFKLNISSGDRFQARMTPVSGLECESRAEVNTQGSERSSARRSVPLMSVINPSVCTL